MIAEVPSKRGDGGSSFLSLSRYITSERDSIDPVTGEILDRGVSIDTNCLSASTAWAEMWGASGQSKRVKDPVYHVVVSWREGEQPTDQQCFEASRAAMKAVGMDGHQYVAAVHRDTGNVHVHLMVNRVHPETYKAVYPHRDFFALDKCMRELEIAQGWSHDNGPFAVHERNGIKVVDWAKETAKDWRRERVDQGKIRLPDVAQKMEAMTGNESFASYVQGLPKGFVLQVLAAPDTDWQHLHTKLFAAGLLIKPKGQGFAIYSATDPKQTPVKASQMHESLGAGKLVKRLGPYQAMATSLERVVADLKPAVRYSPQLPKRDADMRLERRGKRAEEREHLKARYEGYRDSWKVVKAPAKNLMAERQMAAQEAMKERHKEERERIARGEEPSGLLRAMDDLTAQILERVTTNEAVFSMKDLERETVKVLTETGDNNDEARTAALANVDAASVLVLLHPGDEGMEARYSTKAMVRMETLIAEGATYLKGRSQHHVEPKLIQRVMKKYPTISEEQKNAVVHVVSPQHIACIVGDAGTGKSFTSKTVKEIYEEAGYRVLGAASMGKAVDELRKSNGLSPDRCRTLASWEHSWKKTAADNPDKLTRKDVIIVDEAGLLSSRQVKSLLERVKTAGAKVIFMGDQKQLAPIEAGAPFRVIMERVGAAELTDIRRQKEDWSRAASKQFARGEDIAEAFNAYDERGRVRLADTNEKALADVAAAWLADFEADRANPERSHLGAKERIVLAYRNADVRSLNDSIRAELKERGVLGESFKFATIAGERDFAVGDRVVFTQNDPRLGVQNGVLGTVEQAVDKRLTIRTDSGELRGFDQDRYRHIDYGYAITVHKSQGITLDRSYGLATQGVDRALLYVMATRHREQFTMFAARDEFMPRIPGLQREAMDAAQRDRLIKDNMIDVLGKFNLKESTLDFANRRGFDGESAERYQLDQGKALANSLEAFSSPEKGMSKEDRAITQSVLSMVQAAEKQKLQDRFKAERASMRAEKPQEYREWVADRAQDGDRAAISQLRGWAYQEKRAEAAMKREDALAAKTPHVTTDLEGAFEPAEPKQVIDREEERGNKVTFQVNRETGSVSYQINDRQAFTDSGKRIVFDNKESSLDPAVIEAGLRLASEKFRDDKGEPGRIKVYGEGEFQRKLAEAALAVAVDRELDVVFADAELEKRRVAMLAERRQEQALERDVAAEPGHPMTPERADAAERPALPEQGPKMTWAERQRAMQEPEPQLDRHTILVRAENDEVLKLDRAIEERFMSERGARPVEKQGFLAGPASRREAEKWDENFRAMKAQTHEETTALKDHLRSDDPEAKAWREQVLAPHEAKHEVRVDEWKSKREQASRENKLIEQDETKRRRETILDAGKAKEKDLDQGPELEPGEKQFDVTSGDNDKQQDRAKEKPSVDREVDTTPVPSDERSERRKRVLQELHKETPAPAPTPEQARDGDYSQGL
ncbi:MAG: TraI/MobA(P) family conjugative relaxase [Elusimicrobiota bacterium]|jgi:Ti-type conjugative transfer relaxase TraA